MDPNTPSPVPTSTPNQPLVKPPASVHVEGTPNSLPAEVQALRKIEQSNHGPAIASQPVKPVLKPGQPRTHLFGVIPWTGNIGKVFKVGIGCTSLVIGLIVVMLLLTFTSLDTQIFKLTLQGTITDSDSKPIPGATVVLDNTHTTTTDDAGKYKLTGLDIGRFQIKITASGYVDISQEIPLARAFMNYTNTWNFQMQKADNATLKGKFVTDTKDYQFIDDKLSIDNQSFRINNDGTFEIRDLKTGEKTLKFESTNFKDIEKKFALDTSNSNLADIPLTPAGDISGSVASWLREDPVLDLQILVESVDPSFVTIASDGTFLIRDLDIGKTYKVRTIKSGYVNRDYTTTAIKQGQNQIFAFHVVENGLVPFLRKVGNDNEIFVANFDGANEKQLTTGRTEPYAEYITTDFVYYLSTRDGLSSDLGGKALLAYRVNMNTGTSERLTVNTTPLGRIIPNFAAQKLVNVHKGSTQDTKVIEVMNLAGGNRVKIQDVDKNGIVNDVVISDDGKFIYYYIQDKTGATDGLYRSPTDASSEPTKLVTKKNIQIYTVSNNGDQVVYAALNTDTSQLDLSMYTVSAGSDTTLVRTFKGSHYQFVRGNQKLLLFQEFRAGGNNAYTLDVSTNAETQLTTFGGTEGIDAVYQQLNLIVYQTNKGLYLMDPTKPKPTKLLTSDFVRYTGYDF